MPEVRTTSPTGGQKGVKLARFDLIPAGPLRELAEHYGRGARKYADNQWRRGYEWTKSLGALSRHLNDVMAGKDYDVCSNDPDGCSFVDADGEPFTPEDADTCFNHTGSHHMAAVAWHAFLLLEFKDTHPELDDRYKPEVPAAEVKVEWRDPAFLTFDEFCATYSVPARFVAGVDGTDDTEAEDFGPDLLSKRAPYPNRIHQEIYAPVMDGIDPDSVRLYLNKWVNRQA